MGKKKTIEEVREVIEGKNGNGCKLLSTEYVNSNTLLDILCACGESFKKSFSKFQQGQKQCPKCGNKKGHGKQRNTIKCKCDYCHEETEKTPSQYNRSKLHFCNTECRDKYIQENNLKIVICPICKKEFKVPKSKNNQENYYCSMECYNKFKSEKMKIDNPMKNPEISSKFKGENNYFYGVHLYGEDNGNYNHNLTEEERKDKSIKKRNYPEYLNWRNEICERDNYTCQVCGNTKSDSFNVHHIFGYTEYKDLRTEIYNGICLCEECHKEYHKIYGNKFYNDWEHFREFLYNKYLQTNNLYFLALIEEIDLRLIQLNKAS